MMSGFCSIFLKMFNPYGVKSLSHELFNNNPCPTGNKANRN